MITSGFFNSINGDRKYDAEQMSCLFAGLFDDGVFKNIGQMFNVSLGTDTNTVIVNPGRAWLSNHWINNDSKIVVSLNSASALTERYDAIILQMSLLDADRAGSINILQGAEANAGKAVKPACKKTDTCVRMPIAYIKRRVGANAITSADITNVVGTSECPYIMSPATVNANLITVQKAIDKNTELIEQNTARIDGVSPKVSKSGTYITIENSMAGNLTIADYAINLCMVSLETAKDQNILGTWNNNIYTCNGGSFTVNSDGTIVVDGKFTGDVFFVFDKRKFSKNYSKAILSGCPTNNEMYHLMAYTPSSHMGDYGNGAKGNLGTATTYGVTCVIGVKSGAVLNKVIFKPMLEAGSVAHPFVPYSGTKFGVCGTNLWNASSYVKNDDGSYLFDKLHLASGEYSISVNRESKFIKMLYSDGTYSESILASSETKATFTIDKNVIGLLYSDDKSDITGLEIMLVSGKTVITKYQEYISDTKSLSSDEYQSGCSVQLPCYDGTTHVWNELNTNMSVTYVADYIKYENIAKPQETVNYLKEAL